jgi:hypothetical protein
MHKKTADVRKDFLHEATANISKSHAAVVMEDLMIIS